jgi:hypothetical protein
MEVHAHTHTPRKKWTHYLWEFLMLFLAVFSGFLAENWREHIIEKKREKEYIASFIEDVKLDTASLSASLKKREIYLGYFDSLFHLITTDPRSNTNEIYYYARFLPRSRVFQYHDRTIQQLKNSGGLRLIKNRSASDSITIYDNEIVKNVLNQQEAEAKSQDEIFSQLIQIFGARIFETMVDSDGGIRRPENNPALFSVDPGLLNGFAQQIHFLKTTYRLTIGEIKEAAVYAERLILFLKKEYHLE